MKKQQDDFYEEELKLTLDEELEDEENEELEDDYDEDFDPANFMYWFEHVVLVEDFLEDPKAFIQRCRDLMILTEEVSDEEYEDEVDMPKGFLDNYVFGLFCLLTMKENIEHELSVDDFEISEKIFGGKYKLLSINLPEPIRRPLCYRMDIVYEEGKEESARIFTIEKGENNTTFLCSWIMQGGERAHENYSLIPKNANKYMDTIAKIYESGIKE